MLKKLFRKLVIRIRWALCSHEPKIFHSSRRPFLACKKCNKILIV